MTATTEDASSMVADILNALPPTGEYIELVLEADAGDVEAAEGAVNANEDTAPPAMAREARRAELDSFMVVYFYFLCIVMGELFECFGFYCIC